jgi:hypothetical protein
VSYDPSALEGMPGTTHGDSGYYGGSGGSAGLGGYCWKVVVPQATTNYCLNPGAETTGNYSVEGGGSAAISRSTSYRKFGLYSYLVVSGGDNQGASFTLGTLSNGATVTMFVQGTLPPAWDWSLDDTNYHEPQAILTIDDDWTLYGYSFGTGEAVGSTTLYVRQNGAGAGPYRFRLDGIQVEHGTDWTTFCDGDQDGCVWNGAEHGSSSSRTAETRAGGILKDFKIDYGFRVAETVGWGAAQQAVTVGRYATLPGGELDNIKLEPRRAVLAGPLVCSSTSSVNDRRQALLSVLSPASYARGSRGYQPVRLWYICADVVKEIAVHYESGLDMDIKPDNVAYENVAVRFVADDPNWYEIGNSARLLWDNANASFISFYGRLRSTGRWSPLGSPAITAAGGVISTNAILHASDQKVYLGGQWTELDGNANADRIAYYDPSAQTYSAMGAGIPNGAVRVIREAPNGDIYVAGEFTNAGGIGADYVAMWNGSSWSAVGAPAPTAPGSPIIYDMAFDRSGNLYVVGNFVNFTGVASDMDYIAMWDGSSWTAVGAPAPGGSPAAYAVAIDSQDNVWVGGTFSDWGGDTDADNWAKWDGSSWSAPWAMSGAVRALWIDPRNDDMYVGGSFTAANGVTGADNIFRYDGTEARAMSTGTNTAVWDVTGAPDGMIYIAGTFTSAGSVDVTYIARWNGASFVHMDIVKDTWVMDIEIGQSDPTVERLYDVWIGDVASAAEAANYAGTSDPTNDGTESVYPVFKTRRTGGTTATVKTLRNETSGYELYFDYALQDGEVLTVDLEPQAKNITSSYYGKRLDAALANSDMGQWRLRPGENNVSCFVDVSGSPTITAWLEWRDAYNGLD